MKPNIFETLQIFVRSNLFLDGRRRRNWFFGIFDISFAGVVGGGGGYVGGGSVLDAGSGHAAALIIE